MHVLKLIIWATAVLGLAPAVLLSLLHLTSQISLTRHLAKEAALGANADGFSLITSNHLEFGKTLHLEMATGYWPSLCILSATVVFAVGLVFLIPRQRTRIQTGGFARIEPHIQTVMQSRSDIAYVLISTDDEYTAVTFFKQDAGFTLEFYLTREGQDEAVRRLFEKLDVAPVEDSVSDEGTEYETCHLSYPVTGDAARIAELSIQVFTEAFNVTDDQALIFTCEE